MPCTTQEWTEIATDFMNLWNMPNCLGAIDGKLVHIQRPIESGGQYFNYKRSFSVNMMAVVDAHYCFRYVAVGAQGSANDAAVFAESQFGAALSMSTNPLSIPNPALIPGTDIETPRFFVADEAYPLRPYIMKPFSARGLTASERIFNYRLSRARRVVENAFGILVNRFRILMGNMLLQPNQVNEVVMTCCILHNLLRRKLGGPTRCPSQNTDEPAEAVSHVARSTGANYNASAKHVRDKLSSYFVSSGKINSQWKHANISCR